MKTKPLALITLTAIVTLAFLFYVWPGHYTYAPYKNDPWVRMRTDIFTGRTIMQFLNINTGTWSRY